MPRTPRKTLKGPTISVPRHRGSDRLRLAKAEAEPEPEPEPDFFTIAVSIATIRRRSARPACDDGSVVSERTRQASKIAADSVAERLPFDRTEPCRRWRIHRPPRRC